MFCKESFFRLLALSIAIKSNQEPTVTETARHHSSWGAGIASRRYLLVIIPKVQQHMVKKARKIPLTEGAICSGDLPLWESNITPNTIKAAATRTIELKGVLRNIQEAGTANRG